MEARVAFGDQATIFGTEGSESNCADSQCNIMICQVDDIACTEDRRTDLGNKVDPRLRELAHQC